MQAVAARAAFDTLEGAAGRAAVLPRLPNDLGVHDRAAAWTWARAFVRGYGLEDVTDARALEPGDVLVFAEGREGGPSHVALVGYHPWSLWHALGRIKRIGFAMTAGDRPLRLLRCYRPGRKGSWTATP